MGDNNPPQGNSQNAAPAAPAAAAPPNLGNTMNSTGTGGATVGGTSALQRLLQRGQSSATNANSTPTVGGPGSEPQGGRRQSEEGLTTTSTRLQGMLRRSQFNRTRQATQGGPGREQGGGGGGGGGVLSDSDSDKEEEAPLNRSRRNLNALQSSPDSAKRRRRTSFTRQADRQGDGGGSGVRLHVDEADVVRQPLLTHYNYNNHNNTGDGGQQHVSLDMSMSNVDEDAPLPFNTPRHVAHVLAGGLGGEAGEGEDVTSALLPKLGRARSKEAQTAKDKFIVYVESATTGRFFRLALRPSGAFRRQVEDLIQGRKMPSSGSRGQSLSLLLPGGLPPPTAHEKTLQSMDWWYGLLYLILQGILAGSTLWVMYTALTSDTQIDFLRCYSGVALEARRGFFLMSSVCFVGSLDYYLRTKKDSEKWEEVFTHTERTEVVMQVVLYFLTLSSSLVAGVFDMILHYVKANATNVDWSVDFLSTPANAKLLALWYIFSGARGVCCNLAWLIACKIYQDEARRTSSVFKQAKHWNKTLSKAETRMAHLQGERLETIRSKAELVDLVNAQRAGLEATEAALDKLSKVVSGNNGGGFNSARLGDSARARG